jgi:hypothetical protein
LAPKGFAPNGRVEGPLSCSESPLDKAAPLSVLPRDECMTGRRHVQVVHHVTRRGAASPP